MLNEACPRCGTPLNISTLAETLRECPQCRNSFQDQKANAVALLTRGGDNEPRPRALIALTPEFAARYRLIRVVGAGAMGSVVEAIDRRNGDRLVAVKFLMRLNNPSILERFVREVRALASLKHPNILKMFDNGELDGHPYVVTEYLPGGTLRDKLKKAKVLPLDEAIGICCALLRALTACHAAGIVHRDVKPENVLFGEDGSPRLADLGLAKEEGGAELTEDGVALGTPLYMSPEQVQGIPVGPGSDIYSVALILYEMLVGKNPFAAARLANILDHHLRMMPRPIHEVLPHLPPELSAVLNAALVKNLEQRTSDASAMADRLEAVLRIASPEARSRTPGGLPAVTAQTSKPANDERTPASDTRRTAPAGEQKAAPAGLPVETTRVRTEPAPAPAPVRMRSSSRKERPVAPVGEPRDDAAHGARGFAGLPLPVRAALALAPFALLGAIAWSQREVPQVPPAPPTASRSLPPFLIARPSPPTPAPASVAATPATTPQTATASVSARDAGRAGGGGGPFTAAASPEAVTDTDDMVQIPGGTFSMGSPEAFSTDAKAHEVRVRSFWIDRNEVTNERFARFVHAQTYKTDAEKRGKGLVHNGKTLVEVPGATWEHPRGPEDSIDGKELLPVVQVSWNDAFAFATWARKRLPTEAEWERAARGSARGPYPWGDEPPPGRACTGRQPHEGPMAAGSFSANDFGLRDVLGNVREWCSDWYAADFYGNPKADSDPIGPDGGRSKVVRGGSFISPVEELSLPTRREAWPNVAAFDLGFRTARDASQ